MAGKFKSNKFEIKILREEWFERHWIFSIISESVSGDFSSKIREARGFFVDEVTRLDYAETGAPWKETGEAEGGLTSLGESLAPRVKATREFTHRYTF